MYMWVLACGVSAHGLCIFSLLSVYSHEGQGSMESWELNLSAYKLYLRQGASISSCMIFSVEEEEHPQGRVLRNFANIRVKEEGSFVKLHFLKES